MSSAAAGLLLLAIGLLLAAHIVRAARWGLLFPSRYLARRFNLLLGLGVGYAVNAVVPFRLGELVRALLVRKRDGVRFSHVAATILVERVTDMLAVGLLFAVLAVTSGMSWMMPASTFLTAAVLVGGLYAVRHSPGTRLRIWRSASVLNDRLRMGVTDFFWSATEVASLKTLLGWRFLTASVVMWALYLAAYAVLAQAVGLPGAAVLVAMVGRPFDSLLQSVAVGPGTAQAGLLVVVFALAPILAILAYGALRDDRRLMSAWDTVRRRGRSGTAAPAAIRRRFEAAETYSVFLSSLFSGKDQLVSGFGLDGIEDCVIHKFFAGGSDAVTALVEIDERLVIRKFAVGAAAQKLKLQAMWLKARGEGDLPLTPVVGSREHGQSYTYDMPLVTPSNDFYDVIHTSSAAHSRALLGRVIAGLVDFHALTETHAGDTPAISGYLDVKAAKNARTILDFAHGTLLGDSFELNGKHYDFALWDRLLDPAWLRAQIKDDRVAAVHGDLTIENIIVSPNEKLGYYIIDPNPENIFDSPLIDWAKLMQSLHLGYESLNQGISCKLTDGALHLTHLRSQAYADLHQQLETEARDRLGADQLREIYFHEIVNYLRLTTYKIRQSPARGLGFFACTTILLDRYQERYC